MSNLTAIEMILAYFKQCTKKCSKLKLPYMCFMEIFWKKNYHNILIKWLKTPVLFEISYKYN